MSKELESFYEDWAAKREADPLELDYVRRADEWKWSHLEPLIRATGPVPRSVLEFGCGSGDMLELVGRAFPGASLHGVDLAQRMVAMARARLPEARFDVGGIDMLTTGGFHVDLALAIDILEHLEDPGRSARELGRVADRVALKIPLEKRIVRLGLPRKPLIGTRHIAGHLHFWTLAESRRLLAEAGLEILAETCADPPEAIRYHPAVQPAAVPRKPGDVAGLMRAAHRAFEVGMERWTCAHQSTLHRLLFGSSHFVLARRAHAFVAR